MPPRLTLRRASRADLPALTAVDPRLVTESGRAGHIGDLLDLGVSWLAKMKGEAVGYVVVSDHFFAHPFVDLLVVGEAHRRRGVGGKLMAKAEADHDDDRLFTSTNQSNLPMRALLAGRGYQVSGLIDNLDPDDPEIVYVKFKSRD